nr:EOG090X0CJA [Eurycercus lamellatus]
MSGNDENQPDGSSTNSQSSPRVGTNALISHIMQNKVDFALYCTRVLTIVFTFNYLIPILGNGHSMYSKALLANAATSALRLHQRLPRATLSREFFGQLFMEDSAHYLLYSMTFLYSAPITWVLLPIFLFALLHVSSYSQQLLEKLGNNSLTGILKMGIGFVEVNSAGILKTIALSEIFLFPMALVGLFSGRATMMTVFVYYRFLTMRYASRRNNYSRNAFYELRVLVEQYSNRPGCPEAVRNIANKAIAFISSRAPLTVQPQQTNE